MFDSIPATVFRDGTPQALTDEQEKLKREIYEKMNPRRRKFVDVSVTRTGTRSRSPTILWTCAWM